MKEHRHAELLRLAADNADQLFECDEYAYEMNIAYVLYHDEWNWRPVKQAKKIKRWFWSASDGTVSEALWAENELKEYGHDEFYTVKLLWSETEFEVSDD